jgi:hypothetical protein
METEPAGVVDALIMAFGSLTKTAKALGHKHPTTVDGWRRSGRIPNWRWPEVIAGAERAGVVLPPSVRRAAGLAPSSEQPVEAESGEQHPGGDAEGQGERVDTTQERPKAA